MNQQCQSSQKTWLYRVNLPYWLLHKHNTISHKIYHCIKLLDGNICLPRFLPIHPTFHNTLNIFVTPTYSDITILLLNLTSSSSLDPIPIQLFHDIASEIAQPLNDIFTKLLNSGIVPSIYKHAIITTILKRPTMSPTSSTTFDPYQIGQYFPKHLNALSPSN